MKYLVAILMPLLLLAQVQNYPDKIITMDGKEYPCSIENFDDVSVQLIYGKNKSVGVGYISIKTLTLGNYGVVYSDSTGLMKDIKELNKIILLRTPKIKDKKVEELAASEPKFSFGMYYIPNVLYRSSFYYDHYTGASISDYTYYLTKFEADWGYQINERINLSLSIGYTYESAEVKDDTYHYSSGEEEFDGEIEKDVASIINLLVLAKYYLKPKSIRKASPYIVFGIGKDFTSINYEQKDLYDDDEYTSSWTLEENDEKFLEKYYSPFRIRAGFGGEYFLNESLSLTSVIHFDYLNRKTKYKFNYYNSSGTSKYTGTNTIKSSAIDTNIGLGLIYYF